MSEEKKEIKVPKQITLGVKTKAYWEDFVKLCHDVNRNPSDIVHQVLDKWLPKEVEYLKKEKEFLIEIGKAREENESEEAEKGGATKNQKKS